MDLGLDTGSFGKRLQRLAGILLRHPQYIPRYVKESVLNPCAYEVWVQSYTGKPLNFKRKEQPLHKRVPWFSYAASDFLKTYLKPDMTVFEWGSGNSTFFFSQRCKTVTSTEDNENWYKLVDSEIRAKGIDNVQLHYCQQSTAGLMPSAFEKTDYFNAIGMDKYDVIVIDGPDPSFNLRPVCFYRAEMNIKPGAMIIVDDSWRYASIRTNNKAKSIQVFESVGPERLGVTSTDIYFY